VGFGEVVAADVEKLFGEHHDGSAFRGFIGKGGKLGGLREIPRIHSGRGNELAGLPVAEGDGSGFIQQQDVHIARRLHRASRGGEHVLARETVDA
jgi:hypothetical protein